MSIQIPTDSINGVSIDIEVIVNVEQDVTDRETFQKIIRIPNLAKLSLVGDDKALCEFGKIHELRRFAFCSDMSPEVFRAFLAAARNSHIIHLQINNLAQLVSDPKIFKKFRKSMYQVNKIWCDTTPSPGLKMLTATKIKVFGLDLVQVRN